VEKVAFLSLIEYEDEEALQGSLPVIRELDEYKRLVKLTAGSFGFECFNYFKVHLIFFQVFFLKVSFILM